MRKTAKKGFTLVELMTVVIIIAILAAVGISTYSTMVTRARSGEGAAALSLLKAKQELYRSRNFTYADDISKLPGYAGASGGKYAHNEYYQIAITAANANSFSATASDALKSIGSKGAGSDVWMLTESSDEPCHTSKGWNEKPDDCAGDFTSP